MKRAMSMLTSQQTTATSAWSGPVRRVLRWPYKVKSSPPKETVVLCSWPSAD
jgi:hypothetical protein